MRQSIDNLHDDITEDVLAQKQIVVDVIDPSPGIWGGDPVEGLVTVVYQCHCEWSKGCDDEHKRPESGHTHHALYGPKDEKDRQPGEPVDHYTCYAS